MVNHCPLTSSCSREINCFLFAPEHFLVGHINLGFTNYPHAFVRMDFIKLPQRQLFTAGNFYSVGSHLISRYSKRFITQTYL